MEVDQNLVNPPPTALPSPSTTLTQFAQPAKKKKIHLTSNDSLFHEIRDRNFATVGAALNRVAKRINADYEARHAAMAGSVPQMRAFVGRLGGLQAEHQAARLRRFFTKVSVSPELIKTLDSWIKSCKRQCRTSLIAHSRYSRVSLVSLLSLI